jgi:hypothetical protein
LVRAFEWAKLTQCDTREERSLRQSDEETTYSEASTAGHCWHAYGADTPSHHHGRQKPPRICLCKPQISGKLANQVANIEGGDTGVPNCICHVQVFLQSRETRVGDIDTIKVAGVYMSIMKTEMCFLILTS